MGLGRLGIFLLILLLGTCLVTVCAGAGFFGWYYYEYSAGERRSLERAAQGAPTPLASGSVQTCRETSGTAARPGRWLADAGAIVNDIGFFAATGNRRDTQFASGDGAVTAALTMDFPRDVTSEPAQFDLRVYQPEGKIVTCRLAIIPKAGTAVYRVEIPRAAPISAEKGRWRVEIVSDDTPLDSADFNRQ